MRNLTAYGASLIAGVALMGAGCKNLPGDKGTQGAVIGGATGAAVGAAVGGKENRVMGAILGGVLGAGGGYVIGANSDKITGKDKDGAIEASSESETDPATAKDALEAATADLNQDGFVTLDEVVALDEAGFSDEEMIERLTATGQVFDLTEEQEEYLRGKGVSQTVVSSMETINQDAKEEILSARQDVISGQPAGR